MMSCGYLEGKPGEYFSEIDEMNQQTIKWVASEQYHQEVLTKVNLDSDKTVNEQLPSVQFQKEECYTRPRSEEDPIGVGMLWGTEIYNYLQEQEQK